MIEPIAKVKITDKATWVKSDPIGISISELVGYSKRLINFDYFKERTVIILSIVPDDFEYNYIEILERFFTKTKGLVTPILTTNDCACYNDMPDLCDDELEDLIENNKELFKQRRIDIGILKGYDAESFEKTRKSLEKHVQTYMLYISGESRSNPRYFSLKAFIDKNFPNGLEKKVYLHGCPFRQIKDIPKLGIDVKGVISARHITDAVYRGNIHYKRETRIKDAWSKWSSAIRNA